MAMSKIGLTLYPFSKHSLPLLLLFESFVPGYEIKEIVSPKGQGGLGQDAGYFDNRYKSGIVVGDDFRKAIDKTEALIIPEGSMNDYLHSQSLSAIVYALEKGKQVFCFLCVPAETKDYLHHISLKNNSSITFYDNNDELCLRVDLQSDKRIMDPLVPVILIGGLLEENNVFEIFAKTLATLRKKGYVVTAFSNSAYCSLIQAHSLRRVFSSRDLCEKEKIDYIAALINMIEKEERPDLILIQAPDAIIRYSDTVPNGYGILTYMLSQAIPIDSCVCCFQSYSGNIEKLAQSISSDTMARLGFSVDFVHLSNTIIDNNILLEKRIISTAKIDIKQIDRALEHTKGGIVPVYNMIDESQFDAFLREFCCKIGI